MPEFLLVRSRLPDGRHSYNVLTTWLDAELRPYVDPDVLPFVVAASEDLDAVIAARHLLSGRAAASLARVRELCENPEA